MSVKSGQAVTVLFSTANASTGAAADATGTPAGTLYVNGTANGASVTVTNITTGLYKAAVTLPSLTAGDVVSIRIAATVSSVAGEGVVWQEVADTKRVSDLNDLAAGAQMDLVDAPNATAVAALGAGAAAAILVTPANLLATDASGLVDLVDVPNSFAIGAIQNGLATTAQLVGITSGLNATYSNTLTIDSNVDAIKAKTDNLPAAPAATGDIPTAAAIRAEIDSNSTQLTAIVADTNELQTNQGNWLTADVSGLAQTGADGDTLETLSDQIDLLSSAAGSGAIAYSITVEDENNDPIDGVEVWITTDSAGSNVIAGTLATDAMGLATFMLDAGTYYIWRQASGFNFTNPVAITVS